MNWLHFFLICGMLLLVSIAGFFITYARYRFSFPTIIYIPILYVALQVGIIMLYLQMGDFPTLGSYIRFGIPIAIAAIFFQQIPVIIYVKKLIVDPLNEIERQIGNASSGDISSIETIKKNNEFGWITKRLAKTTDSIRDVVVDMRESIDTNISISGELTKSSKKVQDAAKGLNEEIKPIASEVKNNREKSEENVEQVKKLNEENKKISHKIKDSHEKATSTSNIAKDSGSEGSKAISKLQELVESSEKTTESIKELEKNNRKIPEIINVIRNISEETTILSLNASINASHAGKEGLAFGVISEEIRRLAEQTTEATQEMEELIKSIEEGVKNVAESIEDTRIKVDEGSMKIKNSLSHFYGVDQSIKNIKDIFETLENEMNKQNELNDEIEKDQITLKEFLTDSDELMQIINNIAIETSKDTESINDYTTRMEITSRESKKLVEKINI